MIEKIKSAVVGVGAFGLAPLVISLASIAAVPIMIRQLGSEIWLSIAVGQAAGEIARAITIWGWNSVGLAVVSSMSAEERITYYLKSVPPRITLLILCILGLIASSFFIPVASVSAYLWISIAGALIGLSGAWAFIGAREPKLLILLDSLPRAATIATAAILLFFIPSVITFGILTLIGNLIAVTGPYILFSRRCKENKILKPKTSAKEIVTIIRSGFSAFIIGFIMTARMSLPVILAPILIPSYAEVIALSDKFMRWGNTAMTPIMQYIQTGIPRLAGTLAQKAVKGTRLVLILGFLIMLMSTVTILTISPLVSGGQIHVDSVVSTIVGVTLGLVFISSVTGNSTLVILGKTGTVAKGAALGFLGMCLLITPLSISFHAKGLVSAYLVAELGILIFQFSVLNKYLKEKR